MKDCASATALVLAGGKSNRMQINKALIPFQGSLLIERIHTQLYTQFSEILMCVSDKRQYDFLDFPQVVDDQPFQGPLVAMLSGLRASKNSINFVIACDIPEINPEHILCREFDIPSAIVLVQFPKDEPCSGIHNTPVIGTFICMIKEIKVAAV